jgi:lipopolysaccharide transport system ATP-binding protein
LPEPAIRAEELGKLYRYAAAPRESFAARWTSRGRKEGRRDVRWALRGVGFEVMPGEGLAIMGHNGAGKSTLLKILARVTRPSTGRFSTQGRLAAILELHAGLHPDWTGRQNVFAKAAIVGAQRSSVRSRFDEIVAFAELEEAIGIPVKRYSTGMRTRLAVSTVLHLDADLLILDEALAGGDRQFQEKCRGRLLEIRAGGTALLLVSHHADTMAGCCERGITLDGGEVVVDGPLHEALDAYHIRRPAVLAAPVTAHVTTTIRPVFRPPPRADDGAVTIGGVRVCAPDGRTVAAAGAATPLGVEVTYEVRGPAVEVAAALSFRDAAGSCAFSVVDAPPGSRGVVRPAGRYRSVAWLPSGFLAPGLLVVEPSLWSSTMGAEPRAHTLGPGGEVSFEVLEGLTPGADAAWAGWPLPGPVRPTVPWTTDFEPLEAGTGAPASSGDPPGATTAP